MRATTDQLRILIVDTPTVADRLACTYELAARLLERWPGAMIVFDQTTGGRQGWLYLPDLCRRGPARADSGWGGRRQAGLDSAVFLGAVRGLRRRPLAGAGQPEDRQQHHCAEQHTE